MCMNTNNNYAPEKLYLHPTANGKVGANWLTFPLTNEDVEYTRTDAFIEKAYEYLSYHLDTSKIDVNYKFDFIEEFRNYMKRE